MKIYIKPSEIMPRAFGDSGDWSSDFEDYQFVLRWRLISAAIILIILLSLVWLDFRCGTPQWLGRPAMVLMPCVLIIGLMAANEILYFSESFAGSVKHWSVYAGTALVVLSSFTPMLWREYPDDCAIGRLGWPLFAMTAAVGLAFVSQIIGYRPGKPVADGVAKSVFIIAYVGLLLSLWAPLRLFHNNEWGMVALLSLLVPVKISDAMAYAFGKAIGRHKLAPNLSPGKTVEGMIGGLLGGCLGALFIFYAVAPWLTGVRINVAWWLILFFGIAVTLAGIIGDLSVSLLKRAAGVKNSSGWLRGLGGIMDIIDSILAASPAALALWATGLYGPVDA